MNRRVIILAGLAAVVAIGIGVVFVHSRATAPQPAQSPSPFVSEASPEPPLVPEVVTPVVPASPKPHPLPTVRPPAPLPIDRTDPGCIVLECVGGALRGCVVTDVRSERSGTWATWAYCAADPPTRDGPPPGWMAR